MKKLAAIGDFKHKNKTASVKLGVIEFQEEGVFIFYAPALDVSGYGNTEEEARKSFDFVMDEFMAHLLKKGTLHKELKRLGWNIRSVNQKSIKAPSIEDLAKNNKHVHELLNGGDIRISQQETSIPVFS